MESTAELDDAPRASERAVATDRAVAAWLFTCAGLVLAMVVVGGVTRLTRSGLSIVEWKPVLGVLPPVGEAAWHAEHAKYLASPEGRLVNAGISLGDFQRIFYVEWAHRLLGRVTGLVALLPWLYWVATRRLRGLEALKLGGIIALGGLQGAFGWIMVKSGLVDRPHVSHYKLALHLSTALLCLALLVWSGLGRAGAPRAAEAPGVLRRATWAALGLLGLAIVWGAFMAGLHAGHVAPSFPTMNGDWVPGGLWSAELGLANLSENAVTVHFVHRALAYAVAFAGLGVASLGLRVPALRARSWALVGLLVLQVTLGAMTVLSHVSIVLAVLHQLNAALVLCALVAVAHALSGDRPARPTPGDRAGPRRAAT